jgi:hypothetical protein
MAEKARDMRGEFFFESAVFPLIFSHVREYENAVDRRRGKIGAFAEVSLTSPAYKNGWRKSTA